MWFVDCSCIHTMHTNTHLPKFSPPQISISMSYFPVSTNLCLSITNNPPAIIGVLQRHRIHVSSSVHWQDEEWNWNWEWDSLAPTQMELGLEDSWELIGTWVDRERDSLYGRNATASFCPPLIWETIPLKVKTPVKPLMCVCVHVCVCACTWMHVCAFMCVCVCLSHFCTVCVQIYRIAEILSHFCVYM